MAHVLVMAEDIVITTHRVVISGLSKIKSTFFIKVILTFFFSKTSVLVTARIELISSQ